jgi:glycosyltransferase involved in cell wall biosynthesis
VTITVPLFALKKGQTSGAEYVVLNMLKGMVRIGIDVEVVVSNEAAFSDAILKWIKQDGIKTLTSKSFGSFSSARFAEEALYALFAKSDQVIFPNYFVPPVKPRIRSSATILYDFQHKAFPHFFSSNKRKWLDYWMPRAAKQADKVLFISDFERHQAERFYGHEFARRSRTVHVALDWERFDPVVAASEALIPTQERPFILSVSQQFPHKRFDLLIRAFGILARRQRDLELVVVGRPAPGLVEDAVASLEPDIASRVRFTGFVSDAELGRLYRQSLFFALPSVYEGFGIPAVEALGLGKSALLVDATAIPEVTLGYARYLPEAAGAAEWASALEEMALSPPQVSAAQALEIRNRYDPEAIARRVCLALND